MKGIDSYILERLKLNKDTKIVNSDVTDFIMKCIVDYSDNDDVLNITNNWVLENNVSFIEFIYHRDRHIRNITSNDVAHVGINYSFSVFLTKFKEYFGSTNKEQDTNCLLNGDGFQIYGNDKAFSFIEQNYMFIAVISDKKKYNN